MDDRPTALPAKPYRPRRWRLLAGIGAGIVVFVAALYFLVIQPAILRYARAEMDAKVAELSMLIGRPVVVGDMTAGLTDAIVLESIEVGSANPGEPLVSLGRTTLDFSLWDVLTGHREPSQVRVEGCRMTLRMQDDEFPEITNLSNAWKRLRNNRAADSLASSGRDGLEHLRMTGCTFSLATSATAAAMPLVRDLRIEADRTGQGNWELNLWGAAHGLAQQPVSFTGVVNVGGSANVYANMDFDIPVSPSLFLGDRLPGDLRLSGLSAQLGPERDRASVEVRGLEVADTASIKLPPAMARFVALSGALSSDRIEIAFQVPGGDLGALGQTEALQSLHSLTVRNLSLGLVAQQPGIGPLQVRSVDLDVSREAAGSGIRVRTDAGGLIQDNQFTRITADVLLSPTFAFRSGELRIAGPFLPRIISAFHPRFLAWNGAELDLTLRAQQQGGDIMASGRLEGHGLTYFWTKLCLVPITDIAFDTEFEAAINLGKETVKLTLDPITVDLARFAVELELTRFSEPRFRVRFYLPEQSCHALATAVPTVMVPRLEGTVLEGMIALDIEVTMDLKTNAVSAFRVDADTDRCRALTLGPLVNLDALNGPFVHEIREEDLDEPILVGPGTSRYVSLERIPLVVRQEALATEDMGFYHHDGFKLGLIRRAAVLNLEKGWFVYGGSTISQQLVKNLYLSREKTLARKLEEAVIVWEMERRVDKDRILELYLNCIEFGRHVYGIREAARVYFNKAPSDLLPLEGAFIMATKPAPRYAFNIYRKREFTDWWVERMRGILSRMWKEMGAIEASEFEDAAPYLPTFYYREDDTYQTPRLKASTLTPPGMPRELPKDDKTANQPAPGAPAPTANTPNAPGPTAPVPAPSPARNNPPGDAETPRVVPLPAPAAPPPAAASPSAALPPPPVIP